MAKLTLEQLSDMMDDYRNEVRRSIGHAQSMAVTKAKIKQAQSNLKDKLWPWGIAQLINWDEDL